MTYIEMSDIKELERLKEKLTKCPEFIKEFFNAKFNIGSLRTRTAYTDTFIKFFGYLTNENIIQSPIEIEVSDLNNIKKANIVNYMRYLESKGIAKKTINKELMTIRSLLKYFKDDDEEILLKNVAENIIEFDIVKKDIQILESNELLDLKDNIFNVMGNTDRKRKLADWQTIRDYAIVMVLLGTGIRVSECVGIDLNDVNLERREILLNRRKGGNAQRIIFHEQVGDAISDYLEARTEYLKNNIMDKDHEDALFISQKKQRLSVRSFQRKATDYSKGKATCHTLRRNAASRLGANCNGDWKAVADAMGHSTIGTTEKSYLAMSSMDRQHELVDNIPIF